jgi:hypothetical protein
MLHEMQLLNYIKNIERYEHRLNHQKVTYDYISQVFGSGYTTSDLMPEKYKHAKCLKLALPDGFQIEIGRSGKFGMKVNYLLIIPIK